MTHEIDLAHHPWFAPWEDPTSGVVSYVLTERVAPFQRAMYHTVRSTSDDGRWVWFSAIFPPSDRFCLAAACLDGARPRMRLFPHCPLTQFGEHPLVAPEGDRATVVIGDALYRQSFDGPPELLFRLGGIAPGHLYRLCTHLSQSCDGRYYVIDAHIGNAFHIVLVDCATGEKRLLKRFYHNHHHALFSPTDPDLILVGQGPWIDPATGERGDEDLRAWIMSVDGTRYDPIMPDIYQRGPLAAVHEFWQPNGRVGWCSMREGVFDADIHEPPNRRERVRIWSRGMTHAHGNSDSTLFCGDTNPYSWRPDTPCGVYFYNRTTGRDVAIAAGLPYPAAIPLCERRKYHFDPHPFFSSDGRHVIYTTTVSGRLDIAYAPIADLRKATE